MTATSAPAARLAADKRDWTLTATLRSAAAERGDHVALQDTHGEQLTYTELLARVETRAAGLAGLGVQSGDRVALLMDNSLEMLLTWFAVNRLGAVEVPCNTANRGRSLEHVLANSGAEVVIIDASFAPVLTEVAAALPGIRAVVVRGPEVSLPWPTHDLMSLTGSAESLSADPCSYRDPAAIIYTSGTTGPAKGVVVSHAHMYLFAGQVMEQLAIGPEDVFYVCLPLFHANAQFMQVYATMQAAGTVVLADAFSASRWVQDVHACGATVSSLLGVMAQYIYNQPPSDLDQQHQVSRMITIPLPAAIAEDFERRFGVVSVEAYGMTEVCLPLFRPADEPLRPGSCGKVVDKYFQAAIVDPDTDEVLPTGEVGEIVIRPLSPFTTFLEYHEMPERTVEAWRNLWFHTGDAGRQDEDGYFYFVDRIKDRIRRKGENVTAYDIEVALLEIEGVQEVAVVAKPASEGEDDIKAYLVVSEEAATDPVAILQHCTARLPYFAVPRYIELISELPKTASGKILKRELRALASSQAEWDREQAGWTVQRGKTELVRSRA